MPKKYSILQEMINQQSAARNTSSTKKHTKIFIRYVPTRPPSPNRQTTTATESNNKARRPHTAYVFLQRVFSGKQNTKQCDTGTNECHAAGFFRGYCLLTTTSRDAASHQEVKLVKYNPRGPGTAATRNAAVWLFLAQ